MDRRGFLKFLGAGVAGIALEQAIPLGRVWSFPKKIAISGVDYGLGPADTAISLHLVDGFSGNTFLATTFYSREAIEKLFITDWEKPFERPFKVGSRIKVRFPQRWQVQP